MEFVYAKKIPKQEKKEEPATEKQIRLLKMIARNVGMKINTDIMTKEKARRVIDQLRLLDRRMNGGSAIKESEQKKRDLEIRLGMAKKRVFQKWTNESKKIDKQTENAFIKEVLYINDVPHRTDSEILSKDVGNHLNGTSYNHSGSLGRN